MANDPRFNTQLVKPCPPSYLGRSGAEIANATSDARKFTNAVGKVGDLEVLNNPRIFGSSGSRVGQGLRTLASVSNSVRTGCGALPTVIGSAIESTIDKGANWVLENVGFSKTLVDQAQYFSPDIANQAYGQAQQIYEQVRQGSFRLQDIPNVLQDFQNLERLARNIYNPPSSVQSRFREFCEASPYAVDLVLRKMKYKFLFLVQFIFNDGYTALGNANFAFVVKNSTLPKMTIEQEDVNYYNFRTKVITRTQFDEMKMAFHDDGFNNATRFWAAYQRATAPVSNFESWAELSLAEEQGLDFDRVNTQVNEQLGDVVVPVTVSSASLGALQGTARTIIQEIRLYHLFDWGRFMNVYKFFNPRITLLEMDNVDMAVSEINEMNITFNFDSVFVDTDVPIADEFYNIKSQQPSAFYPIKNVTSGAESGPSNIGFTSGPIPQNPADCNAGGMQNTTIPPAVLPPGVIPG